MRQFELTDALMEDREGEFYIDTCEAGLKNRQGRKME
jgi:hypothetical protein